MGFIFYDIIFLILFTLFVIIFLYLRRHNLKREGLMYLYRTKFGLNFIELVSRKYSKILKKAEYFVVASGYILMTLITYLIVYTLFIYLKQPASSPIAKIPAIFPLIPYFPELFHLDSIFPPFYFTYFIIAIAIVAISHEFSHGIFARLNKIKIHSTGFAFLGPFLGAFVEQDEKQMNKAGKFAQLSVLSAGTFANVLMTIIFGIIMLLFFVSAFTPSGFIFNSYATSLVNVSEIDSVNNISFANYINLNLSNNSLLTLISKNKTYFADPSFFAYAKSQDSGLLLVYDNSPALRAGLKGAIISINEDKIMSFDDLALSIQKHKPNDLILIKTADDNGVISEYSITLGQKDNRPFLGIGVIPYQKRGILGSWYNLIAKLKDPNIFYKSRIGNLGGFIYDLLWWIVIINILVALFNMFPAGILDGGRFLMLTVWGMSGNKKAGEIALKITTWFLLIFVAIMMVKWLFNIL